MSKTYDPSSIEQKWQKHWEDNHIFSIPKHTHKEKYYVLEMLPYPSGKLHMGHVRNYSIGDVIARYNRMKGYNVMHPMGWDAFGMPAENAAIKHGGHPAKWTYDNIDHMRIQMKKMGLAIDWSREFATCDPDYYKWEQLIFIQMMKKGWVYKKTSKINWCNTCQTVLANEQVSDGCCWRCDASVEMKSMSQWYFRITEFAQELLDDIDNKLQGWPERVRTMQKEWIGRSEGTYIDFDIENHDEKIRVFTTRPDTLHGSTFMCVGCEHSQILNLIKGSQFETKVSAFAKKSAAIDHQSRLQEKYDKEGAFTGLYCINPLSKKRMPIYVANFVLMEYGTGAVMSVPAHDQRDFEFAKKYELPISVVIQKDGETLDPTNMTEAMNDPGILIHSGKFDGMKSTDAIPEITKHLESMGYGEKTITYRLKDWCISRQRYWGTPIPVVYCDECGIVPVAESELPVILPKDVTFTGQGGSPLATCNDFKKAICPRCGMKSRRETDTMDTFVESSWYLLRYICPNETDTILNKEQVNYWAPVDQYIGGIEHAVGHLLYCRYFTKVLRELGYVDFDEPIENLMTQGMVCKDGSKMSKSKGNVVDPDEMTQKYGTDTARMFLLFAAPPVKDMEWSDTGIEGCYRFLNRVWRLTHAYLDHIATNSEVIENKELMRMQHKTIKKMTDDFNRFHFNTAIAASMEYVNFMFAQGIDKLTPEAINTLIILLSPISPHITEELWQLMGHQTLLIDEPWPSYDMAHLKSDTAMMIIQINGKTRDRMDIPVTLSEEDIKKQALALRKVQKYVTDKTIRKIIVVPNKLVNIVI